MSQIQQSVFEDRQDTRAPPNRNRFIIDASVGNAWPLKAARRMARSLLHTHANASCHRAMRTDEEEQNETLTRR